MPVIWIGLRDGGLDPSPVSVQAYPTGTAEVETPNSTN